MILIKHQIGNIVSVRKYPDTRVIVGKVCRITISEDGVYYTIDTGTYQVTGIREEDIISNAEEETVVVNEG